MYSSTTASQPTMSIRCNDSDTTSPHPPPLELGHSGGNVAENQDYENFSMFFEGWLVEQNRHLQDLISASRDPSVRGHEEERLRPLVNCVVRHYEQYYRVKSTSAKRDVLLMFSPSWTSSLESAFLWIGGWRPTMAFHLLYSKSGLQLEANLPDILRGVRSGDLGDLSPGQIVRVDELQRQTISEELEISEKMAKLQESAADSTMVELSQSVTEALMNDGEEEERVDAVLRAKKEELEAILERADNLRLRTLRGVIQILEQLQAVHFLIGAAELHLRLHDWGKKRDESRGQHEAHGS